ncbi:MAG: DUF2237 domain-containing protein [Candidatus Cyclonatronum sp.]|uniref:DUF2237 family protein n=1 Tax=Cyclonatronum sp. TaxID=3024185 RepID=UPI0025C0738A|nr:DUF2237 domain-containing protein [Cyclonatronum sp.]MCH8485695.1 DUF2237 domain-containing protein [Cyclonatronum sp.]
MADKNIFNEPLKSCCTDPLTGFYRDGLCRTDTFDSGRHVVCAVMTDEFLQFSLSRGNDLITPRPDYRFPGLKAGDRWCLCALRWKEALEHGCAPQVELEATAIEALNFIPMNELVKHALKSDA